MPLKRRFSFRFSNQTCIFFIPSVCATCPNYFILLEFITLIVFGKITNYEALHSAVCSFFPVRKEWPSEIIN